MLSSLRSHASAARRYRARARVRGPGEPLAGVAALAGFTRTGPAAAGSGVDGAAQEAAQGGQPGAHHPERLVEQILSVHTQALIEERVQRHPSLLVRGWR